MERRINGRRILPKSPSATNKSFLDPFHCATPPVIAPAPLKPRQRKSSPKSDGEWNAHKDNIIRLYNAENLTLPEVMKEMRRKHEFVAS